MTSAVGCLGPCSVLMSLSCLEWEDPRAASVAVSLFYDFLFVLFMTQASAFVKQRLLQFVISAAFISYNSFC